MLVDGVTPTNSIDDVIHDFLLGVDEAEFDSNFRFKDGILYNNGKAIAKRLDDDTVALTKDTISIEKNDAIIAQLAISGKNFFRINSLSDITDPSLRKKELEEGDYESFSKFARYAGLEISSKDIETLSNAELIKSALISKFEAIEKAEREAARKAELAAKSAAERQTYEDWDAGRIIAANSIVKGAGPSGPRLRVVTKPNGRLEVQNSNGERTGPVVAKDAWQFACQYWYEGKPFLRGYESRYFRERRVVVHEGSLGFGCQTIYKQECERFAELMGWPKKSTGY